MNIFNNYLNYNNKFVMQSLFYLICEILAIHLIFQIIDKTNSIKIIMK
jgi:hypothetical protein